MSPWFGPVGLLGPWQTARVQVNGLAVRSGPALTSSLVAGYRWDASTNSEVLATTAVRLNDGYFVWIEDGPLVIHSVAWYRISNFMRQVDLAPVELLRWDADGDEFHHDYGWIAGGDGSSAYLVADDPLPPPSGEPAFGPAKPAPPYALLYGTGGGQTDTFELDAPPGIRWFAADPDGDRCRITIRLEPEHIEILSAEIIGWDGGEDRWPRDYDHQEPLPTGDHRMTVGGDCSWSLRVVPLLY